ncbi:hypothetical protein [Mesorhizobium sp.]|uniref:hypothetical protein n=1 Tax=Mesorhizobium sp. TaxID=1871066 RepID=UPI00257BF111|nr:hypothetical protein [Mesorhizobium sp.]
MDKRPWRHHLTTLLLLRAGYAYVPYKLAGERDRAEQGSYYLSLRRTQGTIRMDAPDWNPWLEFFLRALQSQKQHLEKKMEREQVMLAALPESSVPILELASEHGRANGGRDREGQRREPQHDQGPSEGAGRAGPSD